MRVRELKRDSERYGTLGIESHPMRVRELKRKDVEQCAEAPRSHPMRVRELKHENRLLEDAYLSRTPCGCVN